jgi:cytochrome c peroxidase
VAKAIASFERTVVSGESPFDRWREGDARAISAQAERGFVLFTGKAQCSLCHQGFNFTDNGFHNIGVRSLTGQDDDGRFAQRHVKVLKGAFKTPTLRDIDQTAPYMHNGMYATLEEVVDHYDRGGDAKTNLSPNIHPLGLSAQEKQDLVAFLHTLTSPPLQVVVPHLPPT